MFPPKAVDRRLEMSHCFLHHYPHTCCYHMLPLTENQTFHLYFILSQLPQRKKDMVAWRLLQVRDHQTFHLSLEVEAFHHQTNYDTATNSHLLTG